MLRNALKKLLRQSRKSSGITDITTELDTLRHVQIESYILNQRTLNPRYQNHKLLTHYEYQVFSQYGEDGIIHEIFERIGTKSKMFVEIGAGDGLENNTMHLLANGWTGLWIEGDTKLADTIQTDYASLLSQNKLSLLHTYITAENSERLLKENGVAKEFDLLSIDIDGNDYWIWKALKKFKPRLVVIEYNASWGPHTEWILRYDPDFRNSGSTNFGASLKSLEKLGKELGYALVGCTFSGVNAFFVRDDLVKNKFVSPLTADAHFEPPRYFLYRQVGHVRNAKVVESFT